MHGDRPYMRFFAILFLDIDTVDSVCLLKQGDTFLGNPKDFFKFANSK